MKHPTPEEFECEVGASNAVLKGTFYYRQLYAAYTQQAEKFELLKEDFVSSLKRETIGQTNLVLQAEELAMVKAELDQQSETIDSWKLFHREIVNRLGLKFVEKKITMQVIKDLVANLATAEQLLERAKEIIERDCSGFSYQQIKKEWLTDYEARKK